MPTHKHYILLGAVLIIALLGSGCGSGSEVQTTAETTATEIIATTTIAVPSTTTISTTTVTPQPGVTVPTPTITTTTSGPSSTLPATTVTISEPGEMEPYVLDEFFTTNRLDRSTPSGTLCWAIWEWSRMHTITGLEVLFAEHPRQEIIYPADYDHEYTLIVALKEMSTPEMVSIADDPQLSKEFQLLAKAFFEQVRTDIKRLEEIGPDGLDFDNFPFFELEDMPFLQTLYEGEANSDECSSPESND